MKTVADVETYLKKNVESLLETPGMYGSQLAVEMQVYQALSLLTFIKRPEDSDSEVVKNSCAKILHDIFGTSKLPASAHGLSMSEFVTIQKKIRDAVYAALGEATS